MLTYVRGVGQRIPTLFCLDVVRFNLVMINIIPKILAGSIWSVVYTWRAWKIFTIGTEHGVPRKFTRFIIKITRKKSYNSLYSVRCASIINVRVFGALCFEGNVKKIYTHTYRIDDLGDGLFFSVSFSFVNSRQP